MKKYPLFVLILLTVTNFSYGQDLAEKRNAKDFIHGVGNKVQKAWNKLKSGVVEQPSIQEKRLQTFYTDEDYEEDNLNYNDIDSMQGRASKFIEVAVKYSNPMVTLEDIDDSINRGPLDPVVRVERAPTTTEATTKQSVIKSSIAKYIGYKMPRRTMQGDTSDAYHNKLHHQPAPVSDLYSDYFKIALPTFIVWGAFVVLCVFGLRPNGLIARFLFTPDADPLTRLV